MLRYGKFIAKKDLPGGPYPVFSGYGVVGFHNEYMYEEPQVVVVCRGVGGSGDIKMSPPKSWVTNLSIVATPGNPQHLDRDFLYWSLLASDRRHIISGSAQYQVTITHLERHEISLPPIAEQRAIAHILGTLDDKIELNRRTNETLEAIARALFKSWFVDFDPVRAKAAGRDTGLPEHIAALFPEAFENSELGDIPEGWAVESLGDHVIADRGLSYNGAGLRDDESGLPMHNLNSIYEGGGYKHEGIKFYGGEYREKHLVRPGDLIITNTEQGFEHRLIGHAAIVPNRYGERGLYSHHIYRVRPRTQSPLSTHYLLQLFNDSIWHQMISAFSNGTTINMLPPDAVVIPQIVVPPEPLVAEFSALAAVVNARVEASAEESRTLAAIRDALLPELISGEIRVKDAEWFVEKAVS